MTQPTSLDYQSHGLNLHKSQMDLAKTRADVMRGQPGDYEAELGLLEDFQASTQTRKPGWRALLDGMTSGLKYSLKSHEGAKKRETYANLEKMLTHFEEVGTHLQRQNEHHQRRQEDMETKVIPSAVGYLTYLQNNPSYEEAFTNLNSRVEQLKAVMSFEGELVALNPRNYEVGIFKDRKTGQLKETPISSLLPPELLQARPDLNSYARLQDTENRKIAQQNADSNQRRADASLLKAQQNGHSCAEDEETKTYLELYKLLKNPDIDPTSGAGTQLKQWVAQNVPVVGGLVGDGLAQQQAYAQACANLKGIMFNKRGYRNQAEFENIHTLDPRLPREEALKVVTHELRKRGIPAPEDTQPSSQVQEPVGYVKVQDPSTGQIGLLSPEQAKIAIARGGVQVS